MANLRFVHALGVLIAIEIGLAALGAANAAVKISKKPTANMNCLAGLCTPTSNKAVLNVNDLTGMLAEGNLTIASGAQARDLEIDSSISWTGTNCLTLDAYRSIAFNKPVVVAGTGALTITTNDGGARGDFHFFDKGHVEFWDLSSKLTVNGHNYILLNKLKGLALAVRRDPSGYYALAKNVSAKNHTYSASPIHDGFGGSFEGLGNTISNLSISDETSGDDVGLFDYYEALGCPDCAIRDIGLLSVSIKGLSSQKIGALVGHVLYGIVTNSYAAGQVSGGNGSKVGGLVGESESSTIVNSHAAMSVLGSGTPTVVGGLVGYLYGACDGGCLGVVDQSYATGPVTGGDSGSVGGLIGYNYGGSATNSYATGAVAGGNNAFVGGLIGSNTDNKNPPTPPTLSASYSTGTVSGGTNATVGGLIGQDADDSQLTNSYWDLDTSGISDPAHGAGNVQNDPGITGLTDAQLKSGLPAGFSPSIWKEKPTVDTGYPYLIDNPPP